MRASTLFALAAAVLIGLGVAVAAKMSGYFNRAEVAKAPEFPVVVAARNLFANDLIDASGVRVRPMKPEERAHYEANKDKYLPALPAAAVLRVANVNIEADQPITREKLKEMAKPTPLNERLLPDMRAVNLTLSKERSAGGNIQVGEWVVVNLTSQISADGQSTTRTAPIAPAVRLIAKRDSLWPVFAPLPKDKPVEYTIEVNAYQSGLIEFSRTKGMLSMAPLPSAEQKKLEANRNERMAASKLGEPVAMAPEEAEDNVKAQEVIKGDRIISDNDLVKLFDLKIEKAPDQTTPPPPATVTIERFIGTKRVEAAVYLLDGSRYNGSNAPGNGSWNGHGWQTGADQYPRGPYSSNVRLSDGKMIPNNAMYYGGGQYYHNNYSFGANGNRGASGSWSGGNGGQPNWKFGAPDCPTCKKNKY